jgi:uncharacterized DUF497 family protein
MENSEFEWDEEKRLSNLVKHGSDFVDAPLLFMNPYAEGRSNDRTSDVGRLSVGSRTNGWPQFALKEAT